MISLSDYEFDITRELINIALANAADAFSKLAQERVLIKGFNLCFLEKEEYYKVLESENKSLFYILSTDIKGKLDGKSYLLFNDDDTRKIFKVFAPNHIEISETGLNEFQQAVLLEIDNILTAAFITQLSNILNLFTYGDVPKILACSKEKTLEYFEQNIKDFDIVLNIHAKFESSDTKMSPSYIWYFKSEFLYAIKNLITDKKQMSLLKNYQ